MSTIQVCKFMDDRSVLALTAKQGIDHEIIPDRDLDHGRRSARVESCQRKLRITYVATYYM